jgi:hypothetical protein
MTRAWAVFTAQVFTLTFGSIPSVFPGDFYESFVKFFNVSQPSLCRRTIVR